MILLGQTRSAKIGFMQPTVTYSAAIPNGMEPFQPFSCFSALRAVDRWRSQGSGGYRDSMHADISQERRRV